VGQLAGGLPTNSTIIWSYLGYSDFLVEEAGDEESLRRGVAEIKAATQRAGSLTRQLLAFSRKQVLEPAILDLNQVIWEAHKLLCRVVPANIGDCPRIGSCLGARESGSGSDPTNSYQPANQCRDAMPQGGKVT